jgi:hypothetical protein
MNLRACVEIMQECFLQLAFLSRENIEKTFLARSGARRIDASVPSSRAVEPLQRCPVCTLM